MTGFSIVVVRVVVVVAVVLVVVVIVAVVAVVVTPKCVGGKLYQMHLWRCPVTRPQNKGSSFINVPVKLGS